MDSLTILYTHYEYDKLNILMDWYNKRFDNFKVVHDISDIPPEKLIRNTNKNVISTELHQLRSNLDIYFANSTSLFEEKADYYNLLETDVILLGQEFVDRCIAYMETHNIHAMFPFLHSNHIDPNGAFAKVLNNIRPKFWALLSNVIIRRNALEYYLSSLQQTPRFWSELMMPSTLAQNSFHITENPFIDANFFYHIPEGKSLNKKQISLAINNGSLGLHPIKDFDLLPYIEETYEKKKTETG